MNGENAKVEENRRVRMTKRMLRDALTELMTRKSIGTITVKEICELADVNRSTFYAYYVNPNSLLDEIETEAMSDIISMVDPSKDSKVRQSLTTLFIYVRSNADLFRALLGGAQREEFRERLYNMILSYYIERENSAWHDFKADEKIKSFLRFMVAGAVELARDWIDRGFYCEPSELAEWIVTLSPSMSVILDGMPAELPAARLEARSCEEAPSET